MGESTLRRTEEAFHAAADLPLAERPALLDELCGADVAMRREVEALLRCLESCEPQFLEGLAFTADAACVPARLGQYRIVRMIGEGGMGRVFEAEQEHPLRRVALKVLHDGPMSAGLLRRFQHEAQVLAYLQHPGIAHIYEAGTFQSGDGGRERPYFAMELVAGRPLDEFVRVRGLGLRERLDLVARLCDAVQYAHERGVIHRDLKPANVLVDEMGQPKILDFGLARITASDVRATTLRTEVGQVLGTLAYMSPEQIAARPEDVDARTDVYALGVILYLLLAGRLPHDLRGQSLPEAGRVIREEEPTRLGSASRAYRGDVETIVAKALAKERERRYGSAAELAADIRRYLHDEPVLARPAGTLYQLGKFARRNKGLVGGVAAAIVVLAVALVGVSAQALRIQREKLRAEELNWFMGSVLSAADPYPSATGSALRAKFGANARLVDVLDELVCELDQRPLRDPIAEATIRQKMASSLCGMARYEDGARNAKRSLELLDSGSGAPVELVLEAKLALACNLIFLMDAAAAEALVREVVAGCERVYGPHHEETLRALQCLWLWCYVFGYSDECLEISDRRMEIVRTSPRPLDYVSFQIKAESAVMLQKRRHEVAAAETLAREAVAEGLATRNRTIGVAFSHFALGNSLAARGELAAAEECLRAAVDVLAAASGETASLEFREVLGECVSMQSGREDEGLEMMRSAVDSARAQMGQDSPRAAFMLSSLARRLWNSDRLEEAEERYREYFAMLRRGNHPAIQTHAQNLHDFGRVLLQRGKSAEAERVLRDGLELAGRFSRDQWLRHDWDDRLLLSALAQSLQAQGKDSEAEPVYAQIRERAKDPRKPWEVERLAAELRQLGRAAEADAIGAAD